MNDEDKRLLRCSVISRLDDSGHTARLPVDDKEQDIGRLFGVVLFLDQLRPPLRHLLLVKNDELQFVFWTDAN